MGVKKLIITSVRPRVKLSADELIGHSAEMNKRIEKNIAQNERKIALGMKRAQGIQMH